MRNMRGAAMWLVLALSACRTAAPALPEIDTAALPDAVRRSVDEARAAAVTAPDDAGAVLRLGMILEAHGQLQSALGCYERARALAPERFDAHYYSAFARAANGESEAAIGHLREALRVKPSSLPVELKLAELTRDPGLAGELVRKYPNEATAHYLLGRATRSADAYKRALEIFPRYGAAQFALANIYREEGRANEAQAILGHYDRDKMTVPPIEDPEGAALAELSSSGPGLLRRAQRADAAGRIDEALALHRQAVAQDPTLADAWINLISLHARRGDASEAAAAYAKASTLAPGRADAHYNFGVFCLQQQRWADARQAFQRTVALDARHADAWLNLGSLAGQAGRLDEAAVAFERAVAARPDFGPAWLHLGQVESMRRNAAAAQRAFAKAKEFGAKVE